MANNSNKVAYTREHIEFILENYRNNPVLCVEKTGHSDGLFKFFIILLGGIWLWFLISKL